MACRPKCTSAGHSQNYYYDKDCMHEHNSQWLGRGAEREGLSGEVQQADLARIAYGFDKDNNPQFKNSHQDSAFVDIPMNAPKDVSVLLVVDPQLNSAMDKAIQQTAQWLDENYSKCRVTENGKTSVQEGDGLIIASFKHGTSRANDPNEHCHLLIANQTKADNGKMYSLDSRDIFRDQQLVTATFTSFLAQNVKDLGYSVTPKGNSFSIDGVPQELTDLFSKRTDQLKKLDKEYAEKYPDMNPAKRHDLAVRGSRHSKQQPDKRDLVNSWKEQASALGFRLDNSLVESVKAVERIQSELTPIDHVCISAAIQTMDKPVIARSALLCGALEVGRGESNVNEIVQATKDLTKAGELVATKNDGITTKQNYKRNPEVAKSYKKSSNQTWGKKYSPVEYHPAQHKDNPMWVNPITKQVHFEPRRHDILKSKYSRLTKSTTKVKQTVGGKNHGDVTTTRISGRGIESKAQSTTRKHDGTVVKGHEVIRRSGGIMTKDKTEYFRMADGSKAKCVSESFFAGSKAMGKSTMYYQDGKIEVSTWKGVVGVFDKKLKIEHSEKTITNDNKRTLLELNSRSQRTFNAVGNSLINSAEVIGETVNNMFGLVKAAVCGEIKIQQIQHHDGTKEQIVSKNHEPKGTVQLPKGFELKLDNKLSNKLPAPRQTKDKLAHIEKNMEQKQPPRQKEKTREKGLSL